MANIVGFGRSMRKISVELTKFHLFDTYYTYFEDAITKFVPLIKC